MAEELLEEGTELEAKETVFDPAGLLSVDELHVNVALVLKGLPDRFLRYRVEDDTAYGLALPSGGFEDVPGDRLALPVGVGREVDAVRVLAGGLDLRDDFALVLRHLVPGAELAVGVHAKLVLREVPDVSHGCLDGVAAAKEAADSGRLRRRLDYNQIVSRCGVPASRADRRR